MLTAGRRHRERATNIWPGFVDALGTLLLVILFLLLVFIMAQFFLGEALSGRDQALKRLEGRVSELSELLALERRANDDLRGNVSQLSEELKASIAQRDEQSADIAALQALKDELEDKIAAAARKLDEKGEALLAEKELSESARAKLALANKQLAELKEQLARLNDALDAAEKKNKEQGAQIVSLGKRLNAALATKVNELARARSVFFGKLRDILENRADVRIVGDRFVFQSEVLFKSGEADIGPGGKEQLRRIAESLKEVSASIPTDIDWILRVDGHTDSVPINTPRFPSNLELSAARAISVVKFLKAQGVPPNRLAPTGFGEYWPLDTQGDEIANRRNRRIELKLTQR
jgi:chemotaxis protein MotB